MTRWLAGTFDLSGRDDVPLHAGALAPYSATGIIDRAPLRVLYSGPAHRPTGLLCLLDGHLDNAAELSRELGEPAATALGARAEDLLAACYRRWGSGLLPRLRGDFLLLIWDHERSEGLLARDQLGVRSCFVHEAGDRLCFASEIRHLLALLPQRPAPDATSLAHWVAMSTRPGLQTLYSGIRRISPGGMVLLGRDGVRERRYWTPCFEEPLDIRGERSGEVVREALERAVGRRIDARGLTGVTMSGGLDSSSIAAVCVKQAPDRAFACSAVFPEHPAADESDLIEQLRRTLTLRGLVAEVRPGGLLASALESLAAWQMPLRSWGDFWALPLLRGAADAGVRTMLGGDGGDELFESRSYLLADRLLAGRPRQMLALARELPGAGDRPARRDVARAVGSLALVGAVPYRLHEVLRWPSSSSSFAARDTPAWLLRDSVRALVRSEDPLAWKRLDGPRWWAHAAYGVACRIEQNGVFEHHRRRAALAGLEARHPLLDLDLVQLALRLPPEGTFDRHRDRPVLRASMAGLLPDGVRLRARKALFQSLIVDCLRGSDLAIVRGILTDPRAELRAYVAMDGVRRALLDTDAELLSNPFRWMWQVWRLLTAECWLRAQSRPVGEMTTAGLRPSPARVAIRPDR